MRRALRAAVSLVLSVPALVFLAVAAVATRLPTERRRARGERPRLIYGPVPILSLKYMSGAMRRLGYDTATVVEELYGIHGPDDFDAFTHRRRALATSTSRAGRFAGRLLGDYRTFAWSVRRFDVFHSFFDGGFLRHTPLRHLEAQLLHLAGKRLIVMPYGSDTAVPTRTRSMAWRNGLMRNYPALARSERATVRWIDYYTQHADFIVGCLVHAETVPRWDLLTTLFYPIDTDSWTPTGTGSDADGRRAPVVVVHAPNHRGMKGTEFLIEAVEKLRGEGLQVELRLLERVSNRAVREAMEAADIIVDQLLLGYALTAVEGMSLGKPVISNLSDAAYYDVHRWSTGLSGCPIVSTTPERIRDDLRTLVTDAGLRRRIGAASRAYALKHHSYDAMGRLWDAIYGRVWHGEDIDVWAHLPSGLVET